MHLSKSLFIICSSTLIISGSAYGLLKAYQSKLHKRLNNPDYHLSLILQTGPEKKALPTHYLAQLMGLSCNHPTNLYAFSLKKAQKKLLSSPLIEEANIHLIKPSALYVDYTCRQPILALAEYPNIGIDRTGHLFPIEPYLSPKYLPELILGKPLDPPLLQNQLDMKLISELMARFKKENLTRIDLSDIRAKSAGRRQIVVIVNHHILRLSTRNYKKEIDRYFELLPKIENRKTTVDLRIEDIAFIDKENT